MTEAGKVDVAVENYLRNRGYTNAANALRSDPQLQPHLDSLNTLASHLKTAQPELSLPDYLLFYNHNEATNKSIYEDSYDAFRKFVDGCIEIYKIELKRIIWPVFVTMYLDLVAKNEPALSRQFLEKFKQDHIETHTADIKLLSDITLPQHIQASQVAIQYREGKYFVQLSKYSFLLLLNYLQDGQWVLLLRLINQYIRIQIYPAAPNDTKQDHDPTVLGLDADVSEFNKRETLKLGQLPPDPEFLSEIERILNAEGDTTLIDKLKTTNGDAPSRENVPLPPRKLHEAQQELYILKEARNKVVLSGGGNIAPSVCCYTFHNGYDSVNCIAMSKDFSMMCAGFSDSYLRIWNMHDENDLGNRRYVGHSGPVYGASFSKDGKYLISCSEDKTARLWSTITNTNLVCYKGHNYPIWDVDFGPEGIYFATASHDRTARLWSVDQIYPLRIFVGHTSDVDCVRFHPNSNYVVTGSTDRTARLWDVQKGNCVRIFPKHLGPIFSVAVSPDGRTIATGGVDKNIFLWDINSGRVIKQFRGHTDTVNTLTFSNDGGVLASGGADNCVRVWDVKSAEVGEIGSVTTKSNDNSGGIAKKADVVEGKCIGAYMTKRTPIFDIKFNRTNVILAAGVFRRD
ncbi:Transcription initiation factor TFIID subunit 5 [Nowakowskiella sp. JEL0407]|nr:Transcription initiation factor TFIID subunit 5 [Nowakowskiella sp. JEL0407]